MQEHLGSIRNCISTEIPCDSHLRLRVPHPRHWRQALTWLGCPETGKQADTERDTDRHR